MIYSYFKYAFRNLLKQRGHTLINIFGLSFSIAVVIIIFLYVSGELSYNNFHKNADRIYRMYTSVMTPDSEINYSSYQPAEFAEALQESVPGVEATSRLKSTPVYIGLEEEVFQEQVGFVDSSFFQMFTYDFLAGDRETPLHERKSVVLSESVARKIFKDSIDHLDDLIGRTVIFPERPPFNLYKVTAIIADPPKNTSFRWSVLIPYSNADPYPRSNDFGGDTYTYVMLDENNNLQRLEEASQDLVEQVHGEGIRQAIEAGYLKEDEHNYSYHYMHFRDFYLNSDFMWGSYETKGNKKSLYILSSIAALILLIACFNYIMISIGTALNRVRDFGLMNVVGARRWQVLFQFVVESFVLTLISLLLGIILAEQLLPLFNKLSGDNNLAFTLYSRGLNILFLVAILLFIVLNTSFYIGTYLLHRAQPLRFLRREMLSVRRSGVTRVSVVLQFFIAIALLISGGMILKQLNYLLKYDVGIAKKNTVVIHVDFEMQKIQTLKERFLESPHVRSVSMSDRNFDSGSSSFGAQNPKGERISIRLLRADTDYLETLGLELIAGRNFIRDEPDDTIPNVIVNETLVRELELEDPVGERLSLFDGSPGEIIGVIRDFHFDSMHDKIQPLMLYTFDFNSIWYLFVKAEEAQVKAVLEHCEEVWMEVVPEFAWEYTDMSDILEGQYKDEDRWSRIVAYASGIAILLSCLGLMGISGILVARRFKEVGIRKANGASIGKIIVLLNGELLKWVLLAYVFACPAAWFIARRWLQDFAYRTQISWWIFLLAGMAALLISVLTITLQIYRVARQNPVNALRYE
ncbi:MAG: ABC transporter permease [Bacteroidota bacterium]|nr:ABC transporter permease [Bacteroidota bacterium]